MHQLKSLRDSFIPLQGAIETLIIRDMPHDYKRTTNTGKENKNCIKKFAQKYCTKTMSLPIKQ